MTRLICLTILISLSCAQYMSPQQQQQQQQQNPYSQWSNRNQQQQQQQQFGQNPANGQNYQNQIPGGSWGQNTQHLNQPNNGQANSPFGSSSASANATKGGGVTVQIQLRGYSNPSSTLPHGNTCVCPPGKSCSFLKMTPRCYFAFTFIVSSPEDSARYQMTDFFFLDQSGNLPQSSAQSWGQNFVMQLPSKPASIDVIVHHLGAVISQAGQLVQDDTLTNVDSFVIPLKDTLPSVEGVQNMNQQKTYQGKLQGTSLSMSFSISCSGNLIGPHCDMTCTPSHINTNTAACVSNSTGFYSICNYVNGGQVDDCKNCPWGVREGTYCQDEHGSVLDPAEAGLVGYGWRTATIILAIILILALLWMCAMFVYYCFRRRSGRGKEKELVTFKNKSADDREPLNNYRQENHQSAASRTAMLPPTSDKPMKSAMRRPPQNYSPMADGDASSFASDLPVRPSRSEVV